MTVNIHNDIFNILVVDKILEMKTVKKAPNF